MCLTDTTNKVAQWEAELERELERQRQEQKRSNSASRRLEAPPLRY